MAGFEVHENVLWVRQPFGSGIRVLRPKCLIRFGLLFHNAAYIIRRHKLQLLPERTTIQTVASAPRIHASFRARTRIIAVLAAAESDFGMNKQLRNPTADLAKSLELELRPKRFWTLSRLIVAAIFLAG